MKLIPLIFAAFVLLSGDDNRVEAGKKNKNKKKKKKSGTGGSGGHKEKMLTIKITNLSYAQIFSPVFVMVHNEHAPPLYTLGKPDAGLGLKELAEGGNTAYLTGNYTAMHSVLSVKTAMGPVPPGGHAEIDVVVKSSYSLVTLASMAISTNDCFVSVNGMKLNNGFDGVFPGLDAGTEGNTESCEDIPGPTIPTTNSSLFCNGMGTSDGEGFVHIHRGVHGPFDGSDLQSRQMDWRNPMMRVQVMVH